MTKPLYSLIEGLRVDQAANIQLVQGDIDAVSVEHITPDSRQIGAGGLFVAISGYRQDGHAYIDEALRKGAQSIVCEQMPDRPSAGDDDTVWIVVRDARRALATLSQYFYDDPSAALLTIGITGTNGKTTQSYFMESILQEADKAPGVIGTIEQRFCGQVRPASHTTPESHELMKTLNHMRHEGASSLVLEVSSHALEMQRVRGCRLDAAVITNITQDHLDFHGSMEAYAVAKAKIFDLVDAGKSETSGVIIVNGDDEWIQHILADLQPFGQKRVRTIGQAANCDYRIEQIVVETDGSGATLITPAATALAMRIALPGLHNIYNAASAAATALELGINQEVVIRGIAQLRNVPGRLETLRTNEGVQLFVDYAHTEDALANVLKALQELRDHLPSERGRIITLFGCGGNRDRGKRPLMGQVAARLSDLIIVTSDNPRDEDPGSIIDEILVDPTLRRLQDAGSSEQPTVVIETDRRRAIARALEVARKGDMIMVAGKGHEATQEIRGERFAFSDLQVARELMEQKGWTVISA